MKKHCYEIIINNSTKKCTEIVYDYSTNKGKGIKLQISNNGIRIVAYLSILYASDSVVISTNYIISDAIKKALLLHIILYSKNIEIQSVKVSIDGEISEIPIAEKGAMPPVYSLINERLVHKIPNNWKNKEFLEAIVSRTSSNQDTRWASVYSALCAKDKTFEIERFIYLWMSFNGMYNYMSNKITPLRPLTKQGKILNTTEADQLEWMINLYDLGDKRIEKKASKKIANKVIAILRRFDLTEVKSINDIPEDLEHEIEAVLVKDNGDKYDLTAKGYLLVSFAYYFRCNIFHAGKSLPLFCYSDEIELKCLRLINSLLESFIDENLPLIFDDIYIDSTFSDKFNLLAKSAK